MTVRLSPTRLLPYVLALALGGLHYRCGGRSPLALALRHDHPMLHELGILETCPMPVDDPQGWWPDVLPASTPRRP